MIGLPEFVLDISSADTSECFLGQNQLYASTLVLCLDRPPYPSLRTFRIGSQREKLAWIQWSLFRILFKSCGMKGLDFSSQ